MALQDKEKKKEYDKKYWANMPKEKKAEFNKQTRDKRTKRRYEDSMLTLFLRAGTPHEKRAVIKTFNPHFFQFGIKLDPRNPYEENSYGESNS